MLTSKITAPIIQTFSSIQGKIINLDERSLKKWLFVPVISTIVYYVRLNDLGKKISAAKKNDTVLLIIDRTRLHKMAAKGHLAQLVGLVALGAIALVAGSFVGIPLIALGALSYAVALYAVAFKHLDKRRKEKENHQKQAPRSPLTYDPEIISPSSPFYDEVEVQKSITGEKETYLNYYDEQDKIDNAPYLEQIRKAQLQTHYQDKRRPLSLSEFKAQEMAFEEEKVQVKTYESA